jgi:hypothetical protein
MHVYYFFACHLLAPLRQHGPYYLPLLLYSVYAQYGTQSNSKSGKENKVEIFNLKQIVFSIALWLKVTRAQVVGQLSKNKCRTMA